MSGKSAFALVAAFMLIASAEVFRQVTDTLSNAALDRPLKRGSEVLRRVERSLAAVAAEDSLAEDDSGDLAALAAAFRPLATGRPAGGESGDRPAGVVGVRQAARAEEPLVAAGPPSLELKTILTVGDERAALVEAADGTHTVRAGGRIGTERVVSIGADHIVLRGPHGDRRLEFTQMGLRHAAD